MSTVVSAIAVAFTMLAPESRAGDEAPAVITIQPLEGKLLAITPAQWEELPRVSITTTEHGGAQATFEGVAVSELLQRAGAPLGPHLNGAHLRLYLVARAADGYEVVFALAEFDPAFSNRTILVSDRRNGEPLGPTEGPLRLVAPGDKRQARWVRMVQALKIQAAR